MILSGQLMAPSAERPNWRISRILGTPAEFIGYVEAENEKQAIKQAIKQFQITDTKKQEWLVAHKGDPD
jgi:hypothetical protein